MSNVRLQVVLARAGITSRRKAASLIESGRVSVNGKPVRERGFRVDTSKDTIEFDGNALPSPGKHYYYILNKPSGVISTVSDEKKRKSVLDCVKGPSRRLYPVGRLDRDTKGLILLTDDGELCYRLTHPRFGLERVYEARVKGVVDSKALQRIKKGIRVEGKNVSPEKITIRKAGSKFTVLSIVVKEGRKREVRRMFEAVGCEVRELVRTRFGPLKLSGLPEGGYRPLTKEEIIKLKRSVKL